MSAWELSRPQRHPFDWELADGNIVVRGTAKVWHQLVRGELYFRLRCAKRAPYAVLIGQWVKFDEHNVPRPDIVVFD